MQIDKLRNLQSTGVNDFLSTLKSVEINPTELCNRTCVFCPRTDPAIYKNQKKHISVGLCKTIAEQLNSINFSGRIGITGFGEPLLNPKLLECIAELRNCKTARWIEVTTNGDNLTRNLVLKLAEVGCTNITVSMYDNDKSKYFTDMIEDTSIELTLKHHYDIEQNYNLRIVNRIDIVKKTANLNLNKPCYIPFYKIFIDWNGDYLLCQQDWGKTTALYNIQTTNIETYWLRKLHEYRKKLAKGTRMQDPCKYCNIDGTVYGSESFNFFINNEFEYFN